MINRSNKFKYFVLFKNIRLNKCSPRMLSMNTNLYIFDRWCKYNFDILLFYSLGVLLDNNIYYQVVGG